MTDHKAGQRISLGTRLRTWIEDRTGVISEAKRFLDEPVPGGARLQYVFGSVLMYLFMQQVVLGIFLAFYYSPSASDAWASTAYLNDQVAGGWFLRGLHHYGSSAMVVVLALHLLQVVFSGAYRKPREINWLSGLLMAGIVLAFALTGYLLPWDQKGYWATRVATGIMGSLPGGETLQTFVQGGSEYGNLTLTRFYAVHVFILPIALTLLLIVHLKVFRRHGVTPPARLSEAELVAKQQSFYPYQLFYDMTAMVLCAVILLALTLTTHGAELCAPADPASNFVARPEWYFLALFQLLKYFEGPLQIIATAILPGIITAILVALPWLDRAPSRSPRKRIPVLAFIATLFIGITTLMVMAIAEDAQNHSFQQEQEAAKMQAEHARSLAREGILPEGGLAVFLNDPEYEAQLLFKEHCATCHTLAGVGGQEAPSFDRYGSRQWLFDLIRMPNSKQFFGGTKAHDIMEPLPATELADEQLWSLVEYVYSLMGPEAGSIDSQMRARGEKLWNEELECSSCHETKAGLASEGPNLVGRGSETWIIRMIQDSSAAGLFGDSAEMPKFAGKLSEAQIQALAKMIASQRNLP